MLRNFYLLFYSTKNWIFGQFQQTIYLMIIFFQPTERIWNFMQTVSIWDNFHEMSILFPGKNKIQKKYFKMSSAENWCLPLSEQFQ